MNASKTKSMSFLVKPPDNMNAIEIPLMDNSIKYVKCIQIRYSARH